MTPAEALCEEILRLSALRGVPQWLQVALGAAVGRYRRDASSPGYTCPKCGKVSQHPRDLAERYCGACRVFEAP